MPHLSLSLSLSLSLTEPEVPMSYGNGFFLWNVPIQPINQVVHGFNFLRFTGLVLFGPAVDVTPQISPWYSQIENT